MSAAVVIDSLEFARARRSLDGRLPVAGLARISDVLIDSEDTLDYTIAGASDGQPRLNLRVAGTLHLQCQRCLEPMVYRVDIANTLNIVSPGSPTETDDEVLDIVDTPDCIEASAELDVTELIEDEVLLDLPPHPRHDDGTCLSRAAAYEMG